MKVTPFDIYLISLVDDISCMLFVLMLTAIAICVFTALGVGFGCDDEEKVAARKWFKRSAVAFFVSLFITTAVPSSKTIAAMFIVPAVVNNEHLQNSAGNALGILEELTKQWLRKLIKTDNHSKKETSI